LQKSAESIQDASDIVVADARDPVKPILGGGSRSRQAQITDEPSQKAGK
jgi:hypothetical protein